MFCSIKRNSVLQEEAIEYVADFIEKADKMNDGKRRLFLIQTYVIGKERILIEVTHLLCSCKRFCIDQGYKVHRTICRMSHSPAVY